MIRNVLPKLHQEVDERPIKIDRHKRYKRSPEATTTVNYNAVNFMRGESNQLEEKDHEEG